MKKMRLIIGLMSACATIAQAALITVTEDATIKIATRTVNYGSETNLAVGTYTNSAPGYTNKVYLKFDASTLGAGVTVTNVTNIEAYSMQTPTYRDCQIYLITNATFDVAWSEDTITWANAPGNTDSRYGNTLAGPQIGNFAAPTASFQTVGMIAASQMFTDAAVKQALIDGLNNGDRIVTLVLVRGSHSATTPTYASLESTYPGAHAIRMTVETIPEPVTAGLMAFAAGAVIVLRRFLKV